MTDDERLARLSREELAFLTQRGWQEGEPREVCYGAQSYSSCERLRGHELLCRWINFRDDNPPSYIPYVLTELGVRLMPAARELYQALAAFGEVR